MSRETTYILQPHIPHYREEFFKEFGKVVKTELCCYENVNDVKRNNFQKADIKIKQVRSITIGKFLLYNPLDLVKKDCNTLILMLHFGHLTTWLLLITKKIHRRKIILWGHGISVKRFIREEKQPDFLLRWMISLSDGVWFYTHHEAELWRKFFPKMKMVGLNNTIADLDTIINMKFGNKEELRQKYGIKQKTVLIYCARFNEPERRIDLLLEVIQKLNPFSYAIIVIGDGYLKPDFSVYKNVHEFGALYDRKVKNELFELSDIYFQPAWVGLSIVEAMAYSKPVFTFRRKSNLMQCVEYSYIKDGVTGLIFNSVDDLLAKLEIISDQQINELGENARIFASQQLSMQRMVNNALSII